MARAAAFTAVPGWGGVIIGATALVAAAVAGRPQNSFAWLQIWLAEAGLAVTIGLVAVVQKARRSEVPIAGAATRRFLLAFLPALVAGGALTVVFAREHLTERLPGCWLLCYGAAVASGGALSVHVVPIMGVTFMIVGTFALLAPSAWGTLLMAVGFGLLHIGFGFVIARKYGG